LKKKKELIEEEKGKFFLSHILLLILSHFTSNNKYKYHPRALFSNTHVFYFVVLTNDYRFQAKYDTKEMYMGTYLNKGKPLESSIAAFYLSKYILT